jgi:serine/threonine-protein kinase RsbW
MVRVNMRLALSLPRDLASVPMTRRILATTLGTVGVTDECRADILLAVAEACANAVSHATQTDSYDVTIQINDSECTIEVLDTGGGFDVSALDDHASTLDDHASLLADSGRGLRIIQAVSDHFQIEANASTGTLVRFAKRLERTSAL